MSRHGTMSRAHAGAISAGGARELAKDPICGMMVDSVTAKFRSQFGERAVYFCCRHCKEAFDQDPERYRATLVSAE
jgi:P-type Cu+ transporter